MTVKIITTDDNENDILCSLETYCKENHLDYGHGRIGEPTEYFEFFATENHATRYVAQKSGETWFVYRVKPGKKGLVQTIATDNDGDKAVKFAARACSLGLFKEVTNDR